MNTPGDKIALVFQCAAFALLPAVVAICIVAAQRLNPEMWVGRTAKANSALDINTRFILNTFEQFTAYLVAIAVVALYSPPEGARSLPILTALFVLGRILFWVGYHKHPYLRAFGFGITFYPTVAIYIWFVLLNSVRHPHTAVLISVAIINCRVCGVQSTTYRQSKHAHITDERP